ncbi:MAG: secretin N-terminal domain-containing protein [Planctomycetota bacterium]|nr:secretin N-terminal domain-containing protein [Planctomycetota bacterium]
MNPTMEGCEAMARNSKVSSQEALILLIRSALVALLALLLSLSPMTGESPLLAQDPPAGDDTPAPPDPDDPDEDEDDDDSGAADSSDAEQFRMTEGKFPVLNLLRFIQRTTGKFVNYPSSTNDQAFAEETFVDVIGDVDPLTYPIVQAILETNGYELWESTLDDGTIVINVRATSARVPVQSDPVSPIIEAGDETEQEDGEELATLVLQMKYVETSVVRQALQELLGIQGAGSSSGSLKIVTVSNNETLIIKAKIRILEHIQRLVEYIDIEVSGPDRLLQIRELFYADAQDIVSIVQEALSDTGQFGNTGRRTTTGTTQAGRAGSATSRSGISRSTAMAGESTRLIADNRTQKIIIQSTDPDELDLVHQLIDELDTKVRNVRNTTWIYKVNYLKAEELAENIRQLVEGSEGSLRRTSRSSTGSRTTGRGTTGAAGGVQQQQQFTPTRIVPHEQTNSLIIQAEPEEYEEVENILKQIDKRRRQVFLEVALVQVSDSSSLNYTLEFLAGNLDDQALTGIMLSAFGASEVLPSLDPNGILTGLTRTPGVGTGFNAAIQQDGQFPILMNALKQDQDTNILATPFILADDNQENSISVQNEIFYTTSNTTNVNTTTSQQSEQAGITLSLIPTISSEVVLLELELEVSSFAGAPSATGALPPRNTNSIVSKVTIPNGGMFIIGGLAQNQETSTESKVPFLGDLPFVGPLFQGSSGSKLRDNLYVFLSAHILDDDRFNNLGDFTRDAIRGVRSFGDEIRLQQFTDPDNKRDQELSPLTQPMDQD